LLEITLIIICLQVYKRIYKKDNVEFILLPMPRLEVESIADMKVLFEIGAITPDMSLQLSHVMIGDDMDNKRRRLELEREGVKIQRHQQRKLMQADDPRVDPKADNKDAKKELPEKSDKESKDSKG
jgi:hypothetical protein